MENPTGFENHGPTISGDYSAGRADPTPCLRFALPLFTGLARWHLIPCAALQSKSKIVQLVKRRIDEETISLGKVGGLDSPHQTLAAFVVYGNKINDYDVQSASPSRYAPPIALLKQIHGETCMGWTGWVFEMKDGKYFSYGTNSIMEFFDLPDGYSFDDVARAV